MPRQESYKAAPGLLTLVLLLASVVVLAGFTATRFVGGEMFLGLLSAVAFITALVALGGFFIVQPNEAKALVLFGTYKGTVSQDGFWWANPFMTKQTISLRVRNFETAKLKVNDNHSNPIEIGAIVVWKVVDSAEALFDVDDYVRYVEVQAESALRTVATQYPYDSHSAGEHALSTHTEEVSLALEQALADRLR